MSGMLDALLASSPAQLFHRFMASERLRVLAYHDVTHVDQFKEHVQYMCRFLHPVTLAEVCRAAYGDSMLRKNAVLVTFDDGDRSVFEHALPILKEHGVPAVVFVVAGVVDTQEQFWWREVAHLVRKGGWTDIVPGETDAALMVKSLKGLSDTDRLAALQELRSTAREPVPPGKQLSRQELVELTTSGVEIGNHTLTHPCLDRCSPEKIRHELEASQKILTDLVGYRPRALAYPNGNVNYLVRQAAAAAGFETAFLFDHRLASSPPSDPFQISRLRVNSNTPLNRFRIIVSGLHPTIHHAIGRN